MSTQSTARLRLPPQQVLHTRDHASIIPVAFERPESDYGSDLDIEHLLDDLDTGVGVQSQDIIQDLDNDVGFTTDAQHDATTLPLFASQQSEYTDDSIYYSAVEGLPALDPLLQQNPESSLYPSIEVISEYSAHAITNQATNDSLTALYNPPARKGDTISSTAVESPDSKTVEIDGRSPLERFRARKSLSVTDMVSPAWCELQFFLTMASGKKRRTTAAMKQGTIVHAQLEAEVHSFVPVAVSTIEERWALKFWNTIQGLRTLRQTGMTRELEVFGVIEGEIVLGIIDEISYTCQDPSLEDLLVDKKQRRGKTHRLSDSQRTMEQFLKGGMTSAPDGAWPGNPEDLGAPRKIYIADTKTTGKNGIPPENFIKPARMQLMIYRQLLVAIASNEVSADVFFERNRLDPHAKFSAAFVGEIAALDAQFAPSSQASDLEATFNTPEASASELHHYHTLNLLWSLMIQEFMITIPDADETVGQVLNLEYRKSSDGSLIGNHSFPYDAREIDAYVKDEMDFWRGKRPVKGVEIEDAFKCRSCDFAEGCEWRANKVEEAVKRSRSKTSAATSRNSKWKTEAPVTKISSGEAARSMS